MSKSIVVYFIFFLCSLHIKAQEKSFEEISAKTKEIAEKYFADYISMDWNNIEMHLADSSSFGDYTAQFIWGGKTKYGKAAVMEGFRTDFAPIQSMKFIKLRTIFAGNTAIFEGELDWIFLMQSGKKVSCVMPLVTILTIENNFIVEHRDYADYYLFLEEYKRVNFIE